MGCGVETPLAGPLDEAGLGRAGETRLEKEAGARIASSGYGGISAEPPTYGSWPPSTRGRLSVWQQELAVPQGSGLLYGCLAVQGSGQASSPLSQSPLGSLGALPAVIYQDSGFPPQNF